MNPAKNCIITGRCNTLSNSPVSRRNVPLNQRYMMRPGNRIYITVNFKIPVFSWQRSCRDTSNYFLFFLTIDFQVCYGDNFKAMMLSKFQQFRGPHHSSVLSHNLTAQAALFHPCKPCNIHRSLCVSGSYKNAALSCTEREHVSRSAEISRLHIRIYTFHGSYRAFKGGYSGRG